jgi:hypothetical protein
MRAKTRQRVAPLLLVAALAATGAACGGSASTTTSAPPAASADQGWERIRPGGDCKCSDGSEFSFWVRTASPKKVVFYLEDGGACFSAETCEPRRQLYNIKVGEGPAGESGIFDFADERNPFADYSAVYVPYCTADVFLGDTTTKYAPGLTVHHKGYVNGTTALDHLVEQFPRATQVVVIGESAGSVAAPLYAGLVSDRLPKARVTALADGSGSYPDVPRTRAILAAWGTRTALPAWPETTQRWSFPGLFIRTGRHDSRIVFARHDYAYDAQQRRWYPYLGGPAGDLLSRMIANETRIERAGVNVSSYTAPGRDHTALTDGPFYTETVNAERLVDWVTRLIAGKPVADVRCRRCRG